MTDADPFSLLGLKPSLDLPAGIIETASLSALARCHPDTTHARPDSQAIGDEQPEARAAAIHAARETLLNPLARAEAVLQFLGGPSASEHKALPPGFLAQIMETRERLVEEVAREGQPAIDRWRNWGTARRREELAQVRMLLGSHLHDPHKTTQPKPQRDPALTDARVRLNAWRSLERVLEVLDQPCS
jgi:DnaJ-domain-containing protein 1